jgi:hypothetical protein
MSTHAYLNREAGLLSHLKRIDHLDRLAVSERLADRINASNDRLIMPGTLDMMARKENESRIVLANIGRHPNTLDETLIYLTKTYIDKRKYNRVLSTIASRYCNKLHTPPEALDMMANMPKRWGSAMIKYLVAENPDTAYQSLVGLRRDADDYVAEKARLRILRTITNESSI